ncbi:MAG: 4'-phosphopantetheinyl transferase superfamily protein [Oscillospiraceae bacterium]|nr:4'-phosphopantetheinyl transferase superfamily protein [Oscillospiraceae bacterium]
MTFYWYNIKQLDEDAYHRALTQMGSERRRRISDFPAEDDRKRSAAGELLLRQALSEALGCSPEEAPLVWEDSGKPAAAADGVYLSLSHSGPWVLCAIHDRPMGVDVEVIRSADQKFMLRACSESEMAYIAFGREGCYRRFWECWTAKEALFKVTGKGPLLGLSRLELPENVALRYTEENGCAVTVAMAL